MVTPSLQTIGAPHFILDQHGLRSRTQSDPDRVGKLSCASQNLLASCGAEQDMLVWHFGPTQFQLAD
jgi:hypothetical protein